MKKIFKRNRKGFTLIELIIVIAILAILAAVAIPSFIGLQNEAIRGKDIGNATAIVTAVNAYNAMYSTSQITALNAAAITTLTTHNLWPAGISTTGTPSDQDRAIARVTFSGALATVSTT